MPLYFPYLSPYPLTVFTAPHTHAQVNVPWAVKTLTISRGLQYSLATGNWGMQSTQGVLRVRHSWAVALTSTSIWAAWHNMQMSLKCQHVVVMHAVGMHGIAQGVDHLLASPFAA
jgi:hypothetical protein